MEVVGTIYWDLNLFEGFERYPLHGIPQEVIINFNCDDCDDEDDKRATVSFAPDTDRVIFRAIDLMDEVIYETECAEPEDLKAAITEYSQ